MADSLMIEEIFKKLDAIQYNTNIINVLSFISIIIVALIGAYFTYKIHKSEKKDKYILYMGKEKFEAAQSAYNYSIKFISIIHAKDEKKFNLLEEAKKWFNENNLFLYPDIRRDFKLTIDKLYMYKENLDFFYQLKSERNTIKAKEQDQKVKNDFKDIISLNERIQKNIDVYFNT